MTGLDLVRSDWYTPPPDGNRRYWVSLKVKLTQYPIGGPFVF